ncbi:MAG: hypothetical protein HKN24_09565 [Acidimicrobiales bacterium]|nr:hypothetical protein [Acidimicrobiales bacterium]
MSAWEPPPPQSGLDPADPNSLQPDGPAVATPSSAGRDFSAANWVGASVPLVAAVLALLSGLSVEVDINGSWGGNETLLSLLAVIGIAIVFGAPLLFMFRSWGPERSAGVKFFLVLGIAGAYLAAGVASFVLWISVAFTRDPPEC